MSSYQTSFEIPWLPQLRNVSSESDIVVEVNPIK